MLIILCLLKQDKITLNIDLFDKNKTYKDSKNFN